MQWNVFLALTHVISCESCEIIKNTFFTERLLATAFELSFYINGAQLS